MSCSRLLAPIICVLAVASWSPRAEARARVGKKAPWFELQTLKGKSFSLRRLRGRTTVLVVGRTQKAAPPCKKWALEVVKRYGMKLPLYQVIVVDKPWILPRSFVKNRVKKFTPRKLHHRVLLEWYTVFADVYGIKKHDDPVVLVIGRDSVVRWRHRGRMTNAALKRLTGVLRAHQGAGKQASGG